MGGRFGISAKISETEFLVTHSSPPFRVFQGTSKPLITVLYRLILATQYTYFKDIISIIEKLYLAVLLERGKRITLIRKKATCCSLNILLQ